MFQFTRFFKLDTLEYLHFKFPFAILRSSRLSDFVETSSDDCEVKAVLDEADALAAAGGSGRASLLRAISAW